MIRAGIEPAIFRFVAQHLNQSATAVARNMYRIEINIHEKLCVKLVIYKDRSRMHG